MPIKAPEGWPRLNVGDVQEGDLVFGGMFRAPVQPHRPPRIINNVVRPIPPNQFNFPNAADMERARGDMAKRLEEVRLHRERVQQWINPRPAPQPIRPQRQPMRHPDMPQPPQGMFQYVGNPIAWTSAPFDDGREITKEDIV